MEREKILNTCYGVAEDCYRLLDRFESFNSYRFSDFALCWKEFMFSHILSGRFRWGEILEFLDHLFTVCVRCLVGDDGTSWVRRTGGIYICYGLYNKLPEATRRFVTLRVTLSDWKRIEDLLRHVRQEFHHDAHYALVFLFQQGAFQFVATSLQMAPDLYRGKSGVIMSEFAKSRSRTRTEVKQEYSGCGDADKSQLLDSLSQMSAIHERYVAMKSALFKSSDQLHSVSVNPAVEICDRLSLPSLRTSPQSSSGPPSAQLEILPDSAGVSGDVINTSDVNSRHVTTPSDPSQHSENIGDVRSRIRNKAVSRFRPTDLSQ